MKDQFLAKTFGQCIWVLGPDLGLFRGRVCVGNAIARRGRRVDKPFGPGGAGRLKNVRGAVDVGAEIFHRLLNRRDDVSQRRHMEHPIDTIEFSIQLVRVGYVALMNGKARIVDQVGQVLWPSGRKIVDHHNVVAVGQ